MELRKSVPGLITCVLEGFAVPIDPNKDFFSQNDFSNIIIDSTLGSRSASMKD
jgi:hypothetical protein